MKTLLLMRHAKSSWKEADLPDHERPLNKRGKKDAPTMGKLLQERDLIPQTILSSSALRARLTAEALVETCCQSSEVQYLDSFYMAEADEYLLTLRNLPDTLNLVMIIGHNPGLETLLQVLSGQIESLPTAVIAHINLPIEHWSDLNSDTAGELLEIWKPREIRKDDDKKPKDKKKKKDK